MPTRSFLPMLVAATALLCTPLVAHAEVCQTWEQSSPGAVSAEELTEVSGIAASVKNAGVLWVHNDSGDAPALYALSAQGALLGTWTVTDTQNIDWEDITRGSCPDGQGSCLYIADIGNNNQTREDLRIVVVPEPDVPVQDARIEASVAPVATWDVRYPEGIENPDAEALMITPGGKLYIVTKSFTDAHMVELQRQGSVLTGVLKATQRRSSVTAIDIAIDGSRVVFRNYFKGETFVLPRPEYPEDAWAEDATPERFNIRTERQGEAIAFTPDGRLVSLSERLNQPLHYFTCVPPDAPQDATPDLGQDVSSDVSSDDAADASTPSPKAEDSGCAHAPAPPLGWGLVLAGCGAWVWRTRRLA